MVPFPGLRAGRRGSGCWRRCSLVSGELGYEQVAVKHVIERAQASRATFYKHFEDREDCFAQAYERRRRVALPAADRRRQAPAELARGAARGAGRAARVLRQPAGDRQSDLRRGACRGRAGARPTGRFDGAPLPRTRQRAPRDSLSPSSTSCDVHLHGRGYRHACVREVDGRRRRERPRDASRPALLRRHAVLRRGRGLGRDGRGASRRPGTAAPRLPASQLP